PPHALTLSRRPRGWPEKAARRWPGLSPLLIHRPSRSSSSRLRTTTCSMPSRAPLWAPSASGSPAPSTSQAGECSRSQRLQSGCDAEITGDDDLGAVSLHRADDGVRGPVGLKHEPGAEAVREPVSLGGD